MHDQTPVHRMLSGLQGFAFSPSVPLLAATVLLLLLPMIPPNGVLNDNEEHYFAAALHHVVPDAAPVGSAVMGGVPHAFAFFGLVGHSVERFGYETTQILSRILVILLYAFALTRLFSHFALRPVDVILVIGGFHLAGQELMGGEWLFGGAEPKVLAYPLIIWSFVEALRNRLQGAALLLAAATWFHFQVGGFWALLLFAALFIHGTRDRRWILAGATFVLAIAPLVAFLMWQGYGSSWASPDGALPSIGWIIAFFRAPHHVTPIGSLHSLLAWSPGVLLSAVIGALAVLACKSGMRSGQLLAILVALGSAYLLAAFVATGVDSAGYLGPFLLFRPSSLLLLIALLLAAVWTDQLARNGQVLRASAAAVVLAIAVPGLVANWIGPVMRQHASLAAFASVYEFARTRTPRHTKFLIEPELERNLLSFERRTQRPLLVLNKFLPGTSSEIQEWYRRRTFQNAVFAGDCANPAGYRVDYLVTSRSHASRLSPHCGAAAAELGDVIVIEYRYADIAH